MDDKFVCPRGGSDLVRKYLSLGIARSKRLDCMSPVGCHRLVLHVQGGVAISESVVASLYLGMGEEILITIVIKPHLSNGVTRQTVSVLGVYGSNICPGG